MISHRKVFSLAGPLSEIHFPIDRLTKKPKGFAFITYMIPEHAVKAYAEMDGQVFQVQRLNFICYQPTAGKGSY